MSVHRAIGSSLPSRLAPSPRQGGALGLAGLPLGQVAAKRAEKRDGEKNARRWAFTRAMAPYFDRAIEVYLRDRDMKASTFAEEIGVDATTLSKMRAGERIIDADHLEPLRSYGPTAMLLVRADLDRVGLMATVRRAVRFTAADVKDCGMEIMGWIDAIYVDSGFLGMFLSRALYPLDDSARDLLAALEAE